MNAPANRWRDQHRELESLGNELSGEGQHGRANRLWAVAAELKEAGKPERDEQGRWIDHA